MNKRAANNGDIEYFVSGENPRLLIHSGTHGDEYEVTEFVTKCLEKYKKELPTFIYVPEVSPSAIAEKTRRNKQGHDMNRMFFSDSTDPEVQGNIEVLKDNRFDLFVSFHEDPELNEYYLYDVGYRKDQHTLALKHNQLLKENGVNLLNGVDDIEDTSLGFEFVGGYNKMIFQESQVDDGTISAWVLNRHIADEYLLPEIPGKADRKTKAMIVETFFTDVVIKIFQENTKII